MDFLMIMLSPVLEHLNLFLFQLIHAPIIMSHCMLRVVTFFSSDVITLFPLVLLFNWFRRGEKQKKAVLYSMFSVLLAIVINIILGIIWQHPKSLMTQLTQHFLYHPTDNSFPSDHMSFACAISFSLMAYDDLRIQGIVLFVISMLVAWARVYMGFHFPLDMIASLGVSLISAALSLRCVRLVNIIYAYIYPYYYAVFISSIRKGIIK